MKFSFWKKKNIEPKPVKLPKGLPPQYADLMRSDMPRMIREAMKEYGTWEYRADENNPKIIGWAKEIGGWIGSWYKEDSVPWCGLFIGVIAKRAGHPFDQTMLGARNWLKWGVPVTTAKRGDVLVFSRQGGGHVGLYAGEDYKHYHVLGGNQRDQVNIMLIDKDRCIGIRKPKWRIGEPIARQVVYRSMMKNKVSTQEA